MKFKERLKSTARKVSKYGVISGPYFPVFSLNAGKYGPEITPYLDTFHAVKIIYYATHVKTSTQPRTLKLRIKLTRNLFHEKILTPLLPLHNPIFTSAPIMLFSIHKQKFSRKLQKKKSWQE